MKYIKITTTQYYHEQKEIIINFQNDYYKQNLCLKLNYPLEIINGISDELIIPVHNNGLINQAYIQRKVFKEKTCKEEIVKEYLETPNIFLFKGVNKIRANYKNLQIEMENNNE